MADLREGRAHGLAETGLRILTPAGVRSNVMCVAGTARSPKTPPPHTVPLSSFYVIDISMLGYWADARGRVLTADM